MPISARLSKSLRKGVLAAVATPVDGEGRPDLHNFRNLIDFVASHGVDGVVIGGATGEYASFSVDQRALLIAEACHHAAGGFAVLAGIGAQTLRDTLRLADAATRGGCRAVLLAMPCFFRYQQEDLLEYSRTVCRAVDLPCLFYDLPSFTNALDVDNLAALLESDAGFAGIKDSSGDPARLPRLVEARSRREFDLFVGDDSLALEALGAGWDGVISGIACFLPELLVSVSDAFRSGDLESARSLQDDLDRIIERVMQFPVPWAVRVGLEARGISPGDLPLPLSRRRREQVESFRAWCREWIAREPWTLDRKGAWS